MDTLCRVSQSDPQTLKRGKCWLVQVGTLIKGPRRLSGLPFSKPGSLWTVVVNGSVDHECIKELWNLDGHQRSELLDVNGDELA